MGDVYVLVGFIQDKVPFTFALLYRTCTLQIIEKLYKETGVVGPDHIFRALARHGMVRDNKAFFRAGSPLAPVVAASSPEEASDATQMHILNVYALGDEIAGHEVRGVGSAFSLTLIV